MANPGGAGPILPFLIDDIGEQEIGTDTKLIISALNVLFSTEIGEHPIDKDFGHNLTALLFYNFENTSVQTMAKQIVFELLSAYEDRIEIDTINVNPDPDDTAALIIKVDFTNIATGEPAQAEFTI